MAYRFERVPMAGGDYDERWLQRLLFEHPELVPLERIEAGAGEVVMLCRELTLAREGGAVFLDLLGVTRAGRLVLIECKLWRNPQARREVVAQILEYASLLRGWSFGDLTARLKQQRRWSDPNPIFRLAKGKWPDLNEADFVDAVSSSLDSADFHLMIAGDGIRSDVQALAAHLNGTGARPARLSLIEIQLWRSQDGQTIVLPSVPFRTQIIEQKIIVSEAGRPIQVEELRVDGVPQGRASEGVSETEARIDPARAQQREINRLFWDRFIQEARFDHPDQPKPAHGGNNWVKLPLDGPVGWLTAYRSSDGTLGLFLRLSGEEGRGLFDHLQGELDGLRAESGLDLRLIETSAEPFKGEFTVTTAGSELTDDAQIAWLLDHANRFVTLIRPKLSAWHQQNRDAQG